MGHFWSGIGIIDDMFRSFKVCCSLFIIIFLVGCVQSGELPTLVPTAVAPEPIGTATLMIPSPTIPPTITPSPTPSLTPVVALFQPTPMFGTGVNITAPDPNAEYLLGTEFSISGLVQFSPGDTFSVTLVSASGFTLAEAAIEVNDFNGWQGTLSSPTNIGGQALVQAVVLNEAGEVVAQDSVPISLRVDPGANDRYLELYRPTDDALAVAGQNLFFDGRAQLPVENQVTIAIRVDTCQKEVARQSYRLRGSGYWQGFVIIPSDLTGPACAVASFGAPGSADWREIQIPIEVLGPDDKGAANILIGNPPPASVLTPGKSLLLYGTAFGAPESEIVVSVLLENGRLLTEAVTGIDYFGYWEVELYIPADAEGAARIEASFGEEGSDDYILTALPIEIGR